MLYTAGVRERWRDLRLWQTFVFKLFLWQLLHPDVQQEEEEEPRGDWCGSAVSADTSGSKNVKNEEQTVCRAFGAVPTVTPMHM